MFWGCISELIYRSGKSLDVRKIIKKVKQGRTFGTNRQGRVMRDKQHTTTSQLHDQSTVRENPRGVCPESEALTRDEESRTCIPYQLYSIGVSN